MADNGFYFDSTLRASRFENDFTVTATDAVSIRGKVPGQWGWRHVGGRQTFHVHDGWFVEPQSEVSLFHASGGTYRAAEQSVGQDEGGTSAVLRLGLAAGRRIELGKDRVIQPYATLSWLQEFKGVTTVRTNGYGLAPTWGRPRRNWRWPGRRAGGVATSSTLRTRVRQGQQADLALDVPPGLSLRLVAAHH